MHVVLCCLYHTPHVRHAGGATAGTARVDERRSALTADPAHAARWMSLLPLRGRPPRSKAAEPPAPPAAAFRNHSSGETDQYRKFEHASSVSTSACYVCETPFLSCFPTGVDPVRERAFPNIWGVKFKSCR